MEEVRSGREQFFIFLMLTTVVALVCAFVWYLSPLGLGFHDGPTNPETRKIALTVFAVSYFAGIPTLLLGQVFSAILWFCRRTREAYIVPLLSIGSFLLSVTAFWLIFKL